MPSCSDRGTIQRDRDPSQHVPNQQRLFHTLGQSHTEDDLSGLLQGLAEKYCLTHGMTP